MKQLNWGIIGAGVISHQFCQDMPFVNNGKVLAVAARQIESAKKFAEQYQIERSYGGYQQLFEDPDIDVVYIATPHTFHYQNTYDALMAGKSVLCEKPFTVSEEESKALAKLAKKKGLFLMEAMWTYFLPVLKEAKQWVEQGRIGQLKHIKADFGYPLPYDPSRREWDAKLAGGCLLEMGIYPIAIAQYFTAKLMEIKHVEASLADNGVEEDVVILAKADEVKLTLATSFKCKLQNWAYIIGDQGYIAIPNFWRANECMLYQLDQCVDHFADPRQSLGFNFEAQAVGDAIINDQIEEPAIPLSISHALQKQMEQIKAQF